MNIKQLIVAVLLFPACVINAYEVPTHMSMSDIAVTEYFQPQFDYKQIGVEADTKKPPLDMTNEITPIFIDDLHDGTASYLIKKINDHTEAENINDYIRAWVVYGAGAEDCCKRPLNHFFDPYHPGNTISLYGYHPDSDITPDWGVGDVTRKYPKIDQQFSYAFARYYMFLALTSEKKSDRQDNWKNVFMSLGHEMHLIEDMAQPQHVRNDEHLTFPNGDWEHFLCSLGSLVCNPSWYENYVATKTDGLYSGDNYISEITANDADAGFNITNYIDSILSMRSYASTSGLKPRGFWTTSDYDNPSLFPFPEGNAILSNKCDPMFYNSSTNGCRGMADYTNSNFFSAGSNIYGVDGSGMLSASNFPLPTSDQTKESIVSISEALPDTVLNNGNPVINPNTGKDMTEGDVLCNKVLSNIPGQNSDCKMTFLTTTVYDHLIGTATENKFASTYSIFDQKLKDYHAHYCSSSTTCNNSTQEMDAYTLNRVNFDQGAINYLIPRAVAYATAFMEYFFRGHLDMKFDAINNQYTITNKSNDTLKDGTFALYYDVNDKDVTRKLITGWVIKTDIEPNKSMNVPAFIIPTDMKEDGKYILVFTGTMGIETADMFRHNEFGLVYHHPGAVIGQVINLKTVSNVAYVSATQKNVYLVMSDGKIFANDNTGNFVNKNFPGANIIGISKGSNTQHIEVIEGNQLPGKLWGYGWDSLGQLGDGTKLSFLGFVNLYQYQYSPYQYNGSNCNNRQDLTPTLWNFVTAGTATSLAISDNGLGTINTYVWGGTSFGAIGIGGQGKDIQCPYKLSTMQFANDPMVEASLGYGNSVGRTRSGEVFTWGLNTDALGRPDTTRTFVPKTTGITNATTVDAGNGFAVMLDDNHHVFSWGTNQFGTLGTGGANTRVKTQVIFPPKANHSEVEIAKITVGSNHVLALDTDGNVWAWGYNQYGQVGGIIGTNIMTPQKIQLNGTDFGDVKEIYASRDYSLALTETGQLYGWGSNIYGQLGQNPVTLVSTSTPTLVTLP